MKNLSKKKLMSIILTILNLNGVSSACSSGSRGKAPNIPTRSNVSQQGDSQLSEIPIERPLPLRRGNVPERELDGYILSIMDRIENPILREEIFFLYQEDNDELMQVLKDQFKITPEVIARARSIIRENDPEKYANYKENHSKLYRLLDQGLKCKCILPFVHSSRMNFHNIIKKITLLRQRLVRNLGLEPGFLDELQKYTQFITQPFGDSIVYNTLDHVFLKKCLDLLNRNLGTFLTEFSPLINYDGSQVAWFVSDNIKDNLDIITLGKIQANLKEVFREMPSLLESINKFRSDMERYRNLISNENPNEKSGKKEMINELLTMCIGGCDYITTQISNLPRFRHISQPYSGIDLTFSQINILMSIALNSSLQIEEVLDNIIEIL